MQYFVPTLVGALGWTGYVGQYHTIPVYASAVSHLSKQNVQKWYH